MYLSILLPAYNEAQNIVNAVVTNVAAGRELALHFEIVAVDDGSRDETARLLEELKTNYPELRVITHGVNQGLGKTIRTALRAARGEFCILAPADSPHTAETLQPFLKVADGADVILGYRTEKPGYNWLMRFNSRLYHRLLRTICGLPYRDVNWIHLYRRRIFEQIELEFTGIVMEAEVVLKAHELGLRIREVPCLMRERVHGQACAKQPRVMLRAGRDLLRLLWRWRLGHFSGRSSEKALSTEVRS